MNDTEKRTTVMDVRVVVTMPTDRIPNDGDEEQEMLDELDEFNDEILNAFHRVVTARGMRVRVIE